MILALTATDVAAWTALIGAVVAGIVAIIGALKGMTTKSDVQAVQKQVDTAITPRLDRQSEKTAALQEQVTAVALQTPASPPDAGGSKGGRP